MYGFHKVNDLIHSNLTNENQTWEFKHPNFRRGAVGDLQHIKRKSAKTQQLQLQQQLQQQQQQQEQQQRDLQQQHQEQEQREQQQQQREAQQQQYYVTNTGNRNENTFSNIKSEDADMQDNNNPVIKHILRIEDHLLGVTKSCEQLFNEVVHLRMVVSKQQDVSCSFLIPFLGVSNRGAWVHICEITIFTIWAFFHFRQCKIWWMWCRPQPDQTVVR